MTSSEKESDVDGLQGGAGNEGFLAGVLCSFPPISGWRTFLFIVCSRSGRDVGEELRNGSRPDRWTRSERLVFFRRG